MKAKTQVRKSTPRLTQPNDFIVTLRIRARTKRALDTIAREQNRTRVSVIRMLLEDATGTAAD